MTGLFLLHWSFNPVFYFKEMEVNKMEQSKWMDLNGVVEYLPGRWSKRYIYHLISTEQIPHYKPSRNKLIFNRDDIDQWLKDCRVEPGASSEGE
jgi:excisionase family DNA binding protein